MSVPSGETIKARGLFYGWWIVIASALNAAYGSGFWFYGFGVYFKAIQEEFAWGRALTGLAISLSRATGSLVAPVAGVLIDRLGPRSVATGCAMLVGAGYLLLSRVHSLSAFLLVYSLLMSAGAGIVFYSCGSAAIANWFRRKVSFAFGLYTSGNGVGPALALPALAWLMVRYGWRTASVISGIGVFLIVLPLGLVFRHKPEPYGYLPDGGAPGIRDSSEAPRAASLAAEANFTAGQALRTASFWLLLLAEAFRTIGLSSVVTHQVAYLNDLGYSYAFASTALGMMTLLNVPGTFGMGWLGDLMDTRYPLMACQVLMAAGALMLAGINSTADIYLYIVFFGIGFGGQMPLTMAMMRSYFGRRGYATIRGYQSLFMLPATLVGPVLAGRIYDVYNSYYLAFMIVAAVYAVGVAATFFARKPSAARGAAADRPQPALPHSGDG